MTGHVETGFNAQELFEYLARFTQEERERRKVFIRLGQQGQSFNVKTMDYVEDSTYGFFGVSLPCIILNDGQFAPKTET